MPRRPLWIESTGLSVDLLRQEAVEQSLHFRTSRMSESFRGAVQAGLEALAGCEQSRIISALYTTQWGPAALSRAYFEGLFNSPSLAATPLLFQNTTLSVALGQLSLEAHLSCALRTICSSARNSLPTMLTIAAADLKDNPAASVLCIAADEVPAWLHASLRELEPQSVGKRSLSSAGALVFSHERTRESQLAIIDWTTTEACALSGASLKVSEARGPKSMLAFVLGESHEVLAAGLEEQNWSLEILDLGADIEAFSGGIVAAAATASRHAEARQAERAVICIRLSGGGYQWISLGRCGFSQSA